MEDTRVTFETAKLAKEKGFEFRVVWEYILGFKEDSERDKYLPTQSLLAKWLREKHNIIVLVDYEGIDGYYYKYYYYINEVKKYNASDKNYITFEEAYEIGLQESLKLINNK